MKNQGRSRDLYEKHNYLDRSVKSLIGTQILEVDMVDAGFSIVKKLELLPAGVIDKLAALDKRDRNVRIGLLSRGDPEMPKRMLDEFVSIRREFAEANSLGKGDILSVKKDAIYVIGTRPAKLEFSDGAYVFRVKKSYTSYANVAGLEMYLDSESGALDVKGLGEDKIVLHRDYMLSFLRDSLTALERAGRNPVFRLLRDFRADYVRGRLPVGYYRELNRESMYRIEGGDLGRVGLFLSEADEEMKEVIDLSHNYEVLREVIAFSI